MLRSLPLALLAFVLSGCAGAWAWRPPPSHAPGTVHAFARRTLDGELFVQLSIRNEEAHPIEVTADAVAVETVDRHGNATAVEVWMPDEYLAYLGRWHSDRQSVEGLIGPNDPSTRGTQYGNGRDFDLRARQAEADQADRLQRREEAFAEDSGALADSLLWPQLIAPDQTLSGWVVTKPGRGQTLRVTVTVEGVAYALALEPERGAGPFVLNR